MAASIDRLKSRLTLLALCASASLASACGTTATPLSDDDSDDESSEESSRADDDAADDDDNGDDDEMPPDSPKGGSNPSARADASAKPAPSTPDKTKGDAGAPPSGGEGTLNSEWCSVLKIFREDCQSCHGTELKAGAPMSLVTYADAIADAPVSKGKKVSDVVKSRAHDVRKPMPPGKPLSAEKLAAIDAWIAGGAKDGGDANCAGLPEAEKPVEQEWPPAGCEQTYKIVAGNGGRKATIQAGVETHPQFVSDAPWGNTDVQLIASRPITDNGRVLHHWILYANTGSRAHIKGWAPGADNTQYKPLPDDVGIYLPKGPGSLRLDMHYHNVNGTKAEEDASGIELCVTKNLRKNAATTFSGFAAIPNIPPMSEIDTVGTCTVSVRQPVFLISESPHAHTLATHMKLYVKRGGMDIKLHDAPFSFDGQEATYFDEPFELKTGDVVTTTCHFKNDTAKRVGFGEDTGNEMCFNFVQYYPMGALSCSGSRGGFGGL